MVFQIYSHLEMFLFGLDKAVERLSAMAKVKRANFRTHRFLTLHSSHVIGPHLHNAKCLILPPKSSAHKGGKQVG